MGRMYVTVSEKKSASSPRDYYYYYCRCCCCYYRALSEKKSASIPRARASITCHRTRGACGGGALFLCASHTTYRVQSAAPAVASRQTRVGANPRCLRATALFERAGPAPPAEEKQRGEEAEEEPPRLLFLPPVSLLKLGFRLLVVLLRKAAILKTPVLYGPSRSEGVTRGGDCRRGCPSPGPELGFFARASTSGGGRACAQRVL